MHEMNVNPPLEGEIMNMEEDKNEFFQLKQSKFSKRR